MTDKDRANAPLLIDQVEDLAVIAAAEKKARAKWKEKIALADRMAASLDPDSSRWHCWNSRAIRWRKELAELGTCSDSHLAQEG